MLATITEFFGHFHPVVVHLPIGFLLAGLLLQWLSWKDRYQSLQPAIPIILFWGAITATLAVITGYLLSISDDYDKNLVGWHQWMGIAVALVSWILYARERKLKRSFINKMIALVLFVLILITGHLGGSLTHGSDYLTGSLSFSGGDSSNAGIQPIPDVQEAFAYNDVIKPVLQTKCYSCHGPNKQKGKLRMDNAATLMKGGKDGVVIEPGNAASSEMIKRLLLPVDNEDHMPPKEKPQPNETQITLLHWWIDNGADFTKKVKDIPQSEKIKALLVSLQKPPEVKEDLSFIPASPVTPADPSVVERLNKKGIVVMPVSLNSNYLMASFVTHPVIDTADLSLLLQLKEQLIWLKLSYTGVTDADLTMVGQLENLTRLNLDHTSITDKGMDQLKGLPELLYLNLVATKVTARGVIQLKAATRLRSLFLYQSAVKKEDSAAIQQAFPGAVVDFGGYSVETLPTDTVEVKAKKPDK